MISVVVPLFNERASLADLYRELNDASGRLDAPVEIIFVDDGSTDGSWEEIARLAGEDPRVRGVRLRRNFGKSAALATGFARVRGDRVVTLDADLQDPPDQIPEMLAAVSDGADVVNGWKRHRQDPWHKVYPSRVFNWLVSALTGVRLHDHNCGFKAMRADVVREIRLYGELHRFIPVLAAARGFRVSERVVRHRPRKYGESKFGVARFSRGFLDLLTVKFLTGYGRRPQHLLGGIGLCSFSFGMAALTYLAVTWFIRLWAPDRFPPVHERALLGYAIAGLLFGTQLLSIGFLAELLTAYNPHPVGHVSVAEET
jgi:glycosyltransferase involved in cell wall biosynthesis